MLAMSCRFDWLTARRQQPETEEGGPRDFPSPGHGQPVQLRFETELNSMNLVTVGSIVRHSLPI